MTRMTWITRIPGISGLNWLIGTAEVNGLIRITVTGITRLIVRELERLDWIG